MQHFASRTPALAHIAARIVEGLPDSGHAATRKIHAEVIRLQNGANALEKLYATRNPIDTPAAHEKRIATASRKYGEDVKASLGRLSTIVHDGLVDVEKRTSAKVNLVADGFAQEIRSAFRAMNNTQRVELLNELVESNRAPELAAIVKAPGILTGISDEMSTQYAGLIVSKHAPQEAAEQARLMTALEAAVTATKVGDQVAAAYSDPINLSQIERGEEQARAADAAFASALA